MTNLTAAQRRQALRSVYALAADYGMPEAVYVAEHGVTIIANPICAARWSQARTQVAAADVMAPLTVQAIEPLGAAS